MFGIDLDLLQVVAVLLFIGLLVWSVIGPGVKKVGQVTLMILAPLQPVGNVLFGLVRQIPLTPGQAHVRRLAREAQGGTRRAGAASAALSGGVGNRVRGAGATPGADRVVATSQPRKSAAEQIEEVKDRTLGMLQHLPEVTQTPARIGYTIPLLYAGGSWQHLRLGHDGFWGIFGTTGSGKGNAIQHVLLSALELGPELAHVVVVDTKGGLDYAVCDELQHAQLFSGDDAELLLGCQVAVAEMERRYRLMKSARARNWFEYNNRVAEDQQLPLYVVVFDEIGDFKGPAKAKVEKLARMSRAAGFVIIIATQYPTTEVLSSQIQANIANRLVFRVESPEFSAVSLRRSSSFAQPLYEPSLIPFNMQGVAVLRFGGANEIMGRAPHVTEAQSEERIALLRERWGKTVDSTIDAIDRFCAGVSREDANIAAFLGVETPGNAETETLGDVPEDDRFDGLCQVLSGELSDRALLKVMRGKGSTQKNHQLIQAARQKVGTISQT